MSTTQRPAAPPHPRRWAGSAPGPAGVGECYGLDWTSQKPPPHQGCPYGEILPPTHPASHMPPPPLHKWRRGPRAKRAEAPCTAQTSALPYSGWVGGGGCTCGGDGAGGVGGARLAAPSPFVSPTHRARCPSGQVPRSNPSSAALGRWRIAELPNPAGVHPAPPPILASPPSRPYSTGVCCRRSPRRAEGPSTPAAR